MAIEGCGEHTLFDGCDVVVWGNFGQCRTELPKRGQNCPIVIRKTISKNTFIIPSTDTVLVLTLQMVRNYKAKGKK